MGNQPKPIFVSHAYEDREATLALKRMLQECSNGSAEVYVSSDVRTKKHGEDWLRQIRDYITKASVFVFMASPNSLGGLWTRLEVGGALFRSPRLKIVSVCINGLETENLPDPFKRFEASDATTAESLESTIVTLLQDCGIKRNRIKQLDWESEFNGFMDAQEEWRTMDHRLFSACTPEILGRLEPVLRPGSPGRDIPKLYDELIGHLLQSMTFDGSVIDDSFWIAHGRSIKEKHGWDGQRKLAYLLAARHQKLVTGRKDSYGVMELLRRQVGEYRATATEDELGRKESQGFLFKPPEQKISRLFILRRGPDALAEFEPTQLQKLAVQLKQGVSIKLLRWTKTEAPPNFGVYGDIAVGRLDPSGINEIVFETGKISYWRDAFEDLWKQGQEITLSGLPNATERS